MTAAAVEPAATAVGRGASTTGAAAVKRDEQRRRDSSRGVDRAGHAASSASPSGSEGERGVQLAQIIASGAFAPGACSGAAAPGASSRRAGGAAITWRRLTQLGQRLQQQLHSSNGTLDSPRGEAAVQGTSRSSGGSGLSAGLPPSLPHAAGSSGPRASATSAVRPPAPSFWSPPSTQGGGAAAAAAAGNTGAGGGSSYPTRWPALHRCPRRPPALCLLCRQ